MFKLQINNIEGKQNWKMPYHKNVRKAVDLIIIPMI